MWMAETLTRNNVLCDVIFIQLLKFNGASVISSIGVKPFFFSPFSEQDVGGLNHASTRL